MVLLFLSRPHPAKIYHDQRRIIFGLYEKYGLDKSIDYIKSAKLLPNIKAGLRAEVLFYHENKTELKLEALLDVGVKADFTGIKNHQMINFDVTTNVSYKNIDD
jgi:hypothetical protein